LVLSVRLIGVVTNDGLPNLITLIGSDVNCIVIEGVSHLITSLTEETIELSDEIILDAHLLELPMGVSTEIQSEPDGETTSI
jgi:hypothetical protein